MSAFDHLLNVFEIALRAGDRASAEREADAQKTSAAKKRQPTKIKGFGEKKPACCIVKREGQGGQ